MLYHLLAAGDVDSICDCLRNLRFLQKAISFGLAAEIISLLGHVKDERTLESTVSRQKSTTQELFDRLNSGTRLELVHVRRFLQANIKVLKEEPDLLSHFAKYMPTTSLIARTAVLASIQSQSDTRFGRLDWLNKPEVFCSLQ